MRAFVTGATGFIGAALVRRLLAAQVPTAILCRPNSNLWRLGPLAKQVETIEGDLDDIASIETALMRFQPDTCFHLAWHGVGNKHRNDFNQPTRNLQATLRLIELAAKVGCQKWVGAGSQAEYGPQEGALSENAPTHPTTLYGAAKLSAFHLGSRIANHLGLPFAWVRIFSTYGPQDNPDWMIPTLIRTLLARQRPDLTAGEQRWDYLYIQDAADAFYGVGSSPEAIGVFNLGSGEAHPLREIITLIRDRIDPALPLGFGAVPYRPDQVMWLQADCGNLSRATGWKPKWALLDGINETIDWHKTLLT